MRKARAKQAKVSLIEWKLFLVMLQKTAVGHAFCIFQQHSHHNTLTDTTLNKDSLCENETVLGL